MAPVEHSLAFGIHSFINIDISTNQLMIVGFHSLAPCKLQQPSAILLLPTFSSSPIGTHFLSGLTTVNSCGKHQRISFCPRYHYLVKLSLSISLALTPIWRLFTFPIMMV